MEGWEYSLQKTVLSPGTTLLLYTDGLTEATRDGGELFGEERVLEHLSGEGEELSAESLANRMTEEVSTFVGESEQSDDLTLLVVKLSSSSQTR